MSDERPPVNDTEELMISGEELTGLAQAQAPKSLDREDLTGTEDIGANEIRLPRLAIAQGLSPEMTPGDARYIEKLKMFEFFNDLTTDTYGPGPITFVPVRRDVRRIEFKPREEGGGVVDMDVPPGDPRLKFTKGPNGERIPPRATTFTEFIILMLHKGKVPEPIVLSIKETNKFNRRAAENMRTFAKLRNAALYAGLYTVSSKPEKNDKGTFGTYVVKNAGFLNTDTPIGAKLYEHAKKFAQSLEGKEIVVNRDTSTHDADGDADFDADRMEREAAGASQTGSAPQM